MKSKSHIALGRYLVAHYFNNTSPLHARAFLIGCVQPDKNPTTYLKGSLRQQWLRGHNWDNSKKYMQRIASRLAERRKLNILDYYTLGKLIHYTSDAFTYPHNREFQDALQSHIGYEAELQQYFLSYLNTVPAGLLKESDAIMETIRTYHKRYMRTVQSIYTDAFYTVAVCSSIATALLPQSYIKTPSPV